MDIIQNWDNIIFESINKGLSNEFFDIIIPWLRNKYFWIPLYVFLIVKTILKFRIHAYVIILSAVLVVIVSDQFSATILKPLVKRERPCNTKEFSMEETLAPCRNSYSFPSSHATNHFALAAFFSFLFYRFEKRWKYLLYLWAGMVCFAQVYVGLHFFTDVLIGGILGVVIGRVICFLLNKYYLAHYTLTK